MNHFIPLSIPNFSGNELTYVTQTIETEWVSSAGQFITDLEKSFSNYLGIQGTCACQSGTAALHLCLREFSIKEGDMVLVPTLTFIATINPILYQNAIPVFFDCDEHLCINTAQLRLFLEEECIRTDDILQHRESGRRVRAIMPVHIFGETCDMDTIMMLAEEYGLIVIEDATEALGTVFSSGKYLGHKAGTIGNAGAFSFNGNKIITTGGGGLIASRDTAALEHMRYLSQQAKDDTVYFVHNEYGYNYRMSNMQAALGLAQLEQLDTFIDIKRKNYALYCQLLANCSYGKMFPFRSPETSNCWFYSFQLNEPDPDRRDFLIQYLNTKNIQTRPIWKLNHTQKPFVDFPAMSCPMAIRFYDSIINLPCSTNITEEDIRFVCNTLLSL